MKIPFAAAAGLAGLAGLATAAVYSGAMPVANVAHPTPSAASVSRITAPGHDDASGATPTPTPSTSTAPTAAPEASGTHPCNHGFYVSQAAKSHKGGAYTSQVAQSDLGKNGDCSAPLPAPGSVPTPASPRPSDSPDSDTSSGD